MSAEINYKGGTWRLRNQRLEDETGQSFECSTIDSDFFNYLFIKSIFLAYSPSFPQRSGLLVCK